MNLPGFNAEASFNPKIKQYLGKNYYRCTMREWSFSQQPNELGGGEDEFDESNKIEQMKFNYPESEEAMLLGIHDDKA